MAWKGMVVGFGVVVTTGMSCSSDNGTTSETVNDTPPPVDFNVFLPSDVAARAKAIADELRSPICKRTNNCCSRLGLQPLKDCAGQATGLIALAAFVNTDMGQIDPNVFDYGIDETMAKACLDAAKSAEMDCTFDNEHWTGLCNRALIVSRKGSVLSECGGEGDDLPCIARYGQGYACRAGNCAKAVEVATGAACGPNLPDRTIKATCAATDTCHDDVCSPLLDIGQPCEVEDQCGQRSHCRYTDSGRACVAGAPLGAACNGPDEIYCEKGLYCACDVWGCANPRCVVHRAIGESCSSNAECGGGVNECVNQLCTSKVLNWCERPT